jgi:hypothetical protein
MSTYLLKGLLVFALVSGCTTTTKASNTEPRAETKPRLSEACQADSCAACVEQPGCRWFAESVKNTETPRGSCGDAAVYNRFYASHGDFRTVANNLLECAFDDPSMRSVLDTKVKELVATRLPDFKRTEPPAQVSIEKGNEVRFKTAPNRCYSAVVRPVEGAWIRREIPQARLAQASSDRPAPVFSLAARNHLVARVMGPVCTSTASQFVVYFVPHAEDVGNSVDVELYERPATRDEVARAQSLDAPNETPAQTCSRCARVRRECGQQASCADTYVACLRGKGLGTVACAR